MDLPKGLTSVTPFSKLLALLLFVSLPFLGFYLGMKYQSATAIPEEPEVTVEALSARREITYPSKTLPKSEAKPTRTGKPAEDRETSGWNAYTDIQKRWTFKYPPSWNLKPTSPTSGLVFLDTKPIFIAPASEPPITSITIGLNECTNTTTGEKHPCEKSVDELINRLRDSILSDFKISTQISNGIPSTIVSGISKPSPAGDNVFIKTAVTPWKKDYLLKLNLVGGEQEKIFDLILTTLKLSN